MGKLYAQVKDGNIVNVWDSPPPVPVGNDGWRNAVEVHPVTDPRYQYFEGYTADITDELVTFNYVLREIPVADRKIALNNQNDENIINFLKLASSIGIYSTEEIQLERQRAEENKLNINSANTHEELNSLVLHDIRKY